MNSAEKPTIILVNQISKHGHLDLYARLYSLCLLDLGYRVVLVAEQESGISTWIAESRGSFSDEFIFWSRNELRHADELKRAGDLGRAGGGQTLLSRMWRIWKVEGSAGLILRVDLRLRSLRWKRNIAVSRLEHRLPWASQWLQLFLDQSRRGVDFTPLVRELGIAIQRLGTCPQLVFFLYLDMIDDDRRGCRQLERNLDAPWAGILFNPLFYDGSRHVEPERFFRCRNARGAGFLHPHRIAAYEEVFPDLRFGELPDVTDVSVGANGSRVAECLRSAAKGRTIVLLSGSLAPHKGVMQFIDVIHRADKDRFFFAIVGEVFWDSFGGEEPKLRHFLENPPENCFVQLGYIEDERELNCIIGSADVLYAVYSDFRVSSNTLTKAAMLRKPVIVNDEFLMGERVRQYDIGVTVRFGDTGDAIAALELVRRRCEFGFDAYSRDHSVEALKVSLAGLLKSWLAPQKVQ